MSAVEDYQRECKVTANAWAPGLVRTAVADAAIAEETARADKAEAERDWLCRQLASYKMLPGVVAASDIIGALADIWRSAAERYVREV